LTPVSSIMVHRTPGVRAAPLVCSVACLPGLPPPRPPVPPKPPLEPPPPPELAARPTPTGAASPRPRARADTSKTRCDIRIANLLVISPKSDVTPDLLQ